METWLVVVLFLLGIGLIVKGGDFFVDAAVWMAEVSGIPKLIIGATVVSLATTLPEMLVSVFAAIQGKVDMSIGNAVGSVTANIGLIMAISLICMPSAIRRRDYLPKSVLMLCAAGIIVACGFLGKIDLPLAILLFGVLALFLYENLSTAISLSRGVREERKRATSQETIVNLLKFAVGAVGIVVGANLLVDNGSELARLMGISERIIGVTMVAVGTSLPELVTTVTAIAKKQSSLSVGNILGANILDLTLILPLSALISGKALPISPSSAMIDLPVCLFVGLIAVLPAMVTAKFKRWQGVVLLLVYCIYVGFTCSYV